MNGLKLMTALLLMTQVCVASQSEENNMIEFKDIRKVTIGDDNLQLGCIKSCLDYLGKDIPSPWLAGGIGNAFIISIMKDMCAATPSGALFEYFQRGEMEPFCNNLGFDYACFSADSDDVALAAKRAQAFEECKAAMGNGYPCFIYYNFCYQLIAKCDEKGLYTLNGEGPISQHEQDGFELFTIRPFDRTSDDKTTLKSAIRFALAYLEYGEQPQKEYGADADTAHGLAAWDRWIECIENDQPGFMWRIAPTWYTCRDLAAQCMDEAQARIPEKELIPLFKQASAAYREVANHLKPLAVMFSSGSGEEHVRNSKQEIVDHLRAAKASDEKAMQLLSEIVAKLDAKPNK